MNKFKKRTYQNFTEFFDDLRFFFRNRKEIRQVMNPKNFPLAFRERLMLAVTQVNECRYCTWFHKREALKSGISKAELDLMLGGLIDATNETELNALLYAKSWAENNGNAMVAERLGLIRTYGPQKAEQINIILRLIRFGNLSGNSFNYFLYLVSFGWLGK
jgi:AhpD family alkylhydroperoxidase